MASLRRLLQRFSASTAPIEPVESTVSSTPIREKLLTSILGPFEAYVVSIQSILIWEKPYASAVAVTLANILFWLGVYCRYRVYFILISIAAIAFVYRAWVNQIWPEIRVPIPEEEDLEEWTPVHPQVLSVPEISRYLSNMCALGKNWYTWLINMRSEKPSAFFGLMMGTFSILAIIGHHIPGVAIVYTLVMAMMLGPGFMLHVYPNILQYLPSPASLALIMLAQEGKRVHETEQAHDCSGIDEFLPEPSQDNLDALQMPLDISHDEPSSMLIAEELGMHEMIGHVTDDSESNDITLLAVEFENHESSSEASEEDLLPHPEVGQADMKFISSHFDDTSEEEQIIQENSDFNERESGDELDCTPHQDVPRCNVIAFDEIVQEVDSMMAEENVANPDGTRQSSSSDHDFMDYVIISDSDLS